MSTPWARRKLPDLAGQATRVWSWELRSSRDLTQARMSFRSDLRSGGAHAPIHPDDVDVLLLTFEELASNGLRHGRPPVWVTISAIAAGWLIDVSDADPTRSPTPAIDRDPADGGLGLHLVVDLSTTHGWAVSPGRKHVWACVPRAAVA
jgi:two-component sensor histidine kinase